MILKIVSYASLRPLFRPLIRFTRIILKIVSYTLSPTVILTVGYRQLAATAEHQQEVPGRAKADVGGSAASAG